MLVGAEVWLSTSVIMFTEAAAAPAGTMAAAAAAPAAPAAAASNDRRLRSLVSDSAVIPRLLPARPQAPSPTQRACLRPPRDASEASARVRGKRRIPTFPDPPSGTARPAR